MFYYFVYNLVANFCHFPFCSCRVSLPCSHLISCCSSSSYVEHITYRAARLSRVPKSKTPEVQLTTWIIMVSLYVTHNTPNKQLASAWNFPKKTPEGRGISHTNSSTGLDLLLCRIGSAICTNQLGYPLVMSK